jgi:hypothetical protein
VSAVDSGENEGTRSEVKCATARRATERYGATALRAARGSLARARAVTRLHRDDGTRVVVTAAPGRPRVASLVVTLRLPACLAPPRTLKVEAQTAVSVARLPVEVSVVTRGGTWGRVATGTSLRADRTLSATLRSPGRWIRGGEVTVRVRITGRAPFRLSVDRLRLVARY